MIPGSRPRLAVAYGHRSLDALALRTAARGWCDVIWLIDGEDPAAAALKPLLARTGSVVDALGAAPAAAAAALREHAPDGLATFYDTNMEHLARIAEELGVPFNAPPVARALEDKLHQREALRAAGIPSPAVVALPAGIDGEAALSLVRAAGVAFPAMLKPRRASGSWHTFRVDDAAMLLARWADLEDEPAEERVLEEYLPDGPPLPGGFEGDYVSVETVTAGGRATHLATTGRFPPVFPFRETGFFIPSTLVGVELAAVLELASATLAALGVTVGATHTEIKLTADGPRVIEVNGRIGGGVPEMLRLSTGVDVIALAMRAALGLPLEVPAMPATSGVGWRFFYQPPVEARRLEGLDGLEELSALPNVDSVFLHHPIGTPLDVRHGTRTYLFAVVGTAADHAGVVAFDAHLRRAIRARYA
jgi:biotin carboxylase